MNVRKMFYKMSSGSCHVLFDIVMTFWCVHPQTTQQPALCNTPQTAQQSTQQSTPTGGDLRVLDYLVYLKRGHETTVNSKRAQKIIGGKLRDTAS